MSVIASKRGHLDYDREFSKELFNEVADNLAIFTDEEWESIKDTLDYKEVLVAVYIRTNVENLVLLVDKEKFSHISNIPSFVSSSGLYPHLLIDAGLICGKNLIDLAFSFKSPKATERFVYSSTCYPVGAVETSKKYVLVYNVVIDETLLRDTEISLNEGFHFCPIDTLIVEDILQREISKSLIIVKSEDKK